MGAENDTQFEDVRVASVSGDRNRGWTITRDNGWSFALPKDSPIEPSAGMVARFYGAGIGFPVRGLSLDGHVVFYRTVEEEDALRKAEHERFEAECKAMTEATKAYGDEKSMRESKAPTHNTSAELAAYIDSLVDRPHDYGTCVYAMSLAATAAFNHVARKLGVTGFQASCADMDVLRRTRGITGPFMLVQAADLCYPQYDLHARLQEWIAECRPWVGEECRKNLAEVDGAHPDVLAHWKRMAQFAPSAEAPNVS